MISHKIAIIGLGYVGLPLAIEFSKKYNVIGLDNNQQRIDELSIGIDRSQETNTNILKTVKNLIFTTNPIDIIAANIFIITVPTPIDKFKKPDLRPLISASKTVGKALKKGDIVIYESTVYPGCTEEDCVPILEKESGLVFNKDFYCGYSPERINPGDKINTLTNILKVTSGSTPAIAEIVDNLYKTIIVAGTYKAPSIKVAEAAKLIENCQRDLNISFVNELALIFDRMNIDTSEVLDAASTKWNFLKFKPGLVGGHCIGVDPYYMIHKAESLGYYPAVIGAGRKVNDNMGEYVVSKIIKLLLKNNIDIKNVNFLILGFSFKENCSDFRNTRVIDIYNEMISYGITADIHDPHVDFKEVENVYQLKLIGTIIKPYDIVILSVAHDIFLQLPLYRRLFQESKITFDILDRLPIAHNKYNIL